MDYMRGDAMKLYYNPKSRAAIAKWMLDECGANYEIVPIDFTKREHKTPEFLKPKSSRRPISLPRSARRNAAAISR